MKNDETSRPGERRHSFVFIPHMVEIVNAPLVRWRFLNKKPLHQSWWLWLLWPVWAMCSVAWLLGQQAYERVDKFRFNGQLMGRTWVVRNYAWQFMIQAWWPRIRKRILKAVSDAEAEGIEVVGLGAACKDERVNRGGKDVAEWLDREFGSNRRIRVVHGDSLTAAAVVHRALELIRLRGLEGKPVFLTGGTSKIGREVVKSLARRGVTVRLFSTQGEGKAAARVEEIRREVGEAWQRFVQVAKTLEEGRDCGLWITGKWQPGGWELMRHMSDGTVVLNFAVPDPLKPHLVHPGFVWRAIHRLMGRRLPKVIHCDGALIGFDSARTDMWFTMRLQPGITYACHAGTMVHAAVGIDRNWGDEVGDLDSARVQEVWEAAQELGFYLPQFTSFLRPVNVPPRLKIVKDEPASAPPAKPAVGGQ